MTPRELDVLPLIVEGLTNGEVARRLVLGGTTLKMLVGNLRDEAGRVRPGRARVLV